VTDEEKIEKIARELCHAAGKDPDAKIRLGTPMSFPVGECTIVKPLIVPTWKAYWREARRLSMSDAEHAEHGVARTDGGGFSGRRRIRRLRASARMLRRVLRRRLARLQLVARLPALYAATPRPPKMPLFAWENRDHKPVGETPEGGDHEFGARYRHGYGG
jgi:hypothetical protein